MVGANLRECGVGVERELYARARGQGGSGDESEKEGSYEIPSLMLLFNYFGFASY